MKTSASAEKITLCLIFTTQFYVLTVALAPMCFFRYGLMLMKNNPLPNWKLEEKLKERN